MKLKTFLYPPNISKNSISYFKKCVNQNMVSTAGEMVNKFEDLIKKYTKSKYAIAFNSGSAALEIALKALNIEKKTEIIVPTLTFVATINSVLHNDCKPIFMDCDDYYNIDCLKTIDFLNNKTYQKNRNCFNKKTNKKISALLVTHVWGNAAKINELIKICKLKNIKVIEDASESLGTFYKINKKHTGTLGDIGVISFNANKIITTGGGGMLLTSKKKYALKAKHLSTQAKKNPVYFIHDEVGYNCRMTNIAAALGISQLKLLKRFLSKKKIIRQNYKYYLKNLKTFELSSTPNYGVNNNWMNMVKSQKPLNLKIIIKKFYDKQIQVRPVWKLNHLQKPFKKFQIYKITKAIHLYDRSLCLPSSPFLTKNEIKKITSVLK